jgi:alpha-tubulin suppressor-like RCC1 family protein
MRAKVAAGLALATLGLLAACGFGIDVDGAFAGAGAAGGGVTDGGVAEASIPSLQVLQLAAGDTVTCGRRVDGTVMCWGSNDDGKLGNGEDISSSTPVLVKEISDAVDVAVGNVHACVVHKTGAVSCWGNNAQRQLGDGSTDGSGRPKGVLTLNDAVQVAVGGTSSCAVRKDGTVACWGDNGDGQLGDGTQTGRSQPAPVVGVADATQVACANDAACALVKSGDVFCWGDNQYGAAGVDAPDPVLAPVKVAGLSGVKAVVSNASSGHFCALLTTGSVRCWGYGSGGALGNGSGDDKNATPVAAVSVDDAISVATGYRYTCAVRKSGTVSCWGSNGWRKLGVGDDSPPDSTSTPVPVLNVTGAQQVAAGVHHTCALLGDGNHISCWGGNVAGALGRGTRVLSEVPVKVAGPPLTAIAPGTGRACGIDGQGGVLCWGINDQNQLGDDTVPATGTPLPVKDVAGATRISGGNQHACAVVGGGEVRCWGDDQYGELGNGSTPDSTLQVTFAAGGPATDVVGGYNYSCALLASGEVACAGQGGHVGNNGGTTSTPALVSDTGGGVDGGPPGPLSGVTVLAGGGSHTCAIHGTTLTCWGSDQYGQRGPGGDPTNDVPLSGTPIALSGDGDHTCAILQGGAVSCWGRNDYGQTTGSGDGPTPKPIDLGGKAATALASGYLHTCALLDDATVRCWGRGTSGQIGNGVRADSLSPAVVKDLAGVKAIAAYDAETCAILNDGSAWCWGDNEVGELGDGTVMTTGVPGAVVGY